MHRNHRQRQTYVFIECDDRQVFRFHTPLATAETKPVFPPPVPTRLQAFTLQRNSCPKHGVNDLVRSSLPCIVQHFSSSSYTSAVATIACIGNARSVLVSASSQDPKLAYSCKSSRKRSEQNVQILSRFIIYQQRWRKSSSSRVLRTWLQG